LVLSADEAVVRKDVSSSEMKLSSGCEDKMDVCSAKACSQNCVRTSSASSRVEARRDESEKDTSAVVKKPALSRNWVWWTS